jgi:uncharacterized membrane protein
MGSYIGNCFDKQPVNMGRQRELDIAKGIIIILMVFSHAIEIVGWFFEPHAADGFFWYGFDRLIKGSAPVYMICMGINLCYSKRQAVKDLVRRAMNMLGMVVLLEFSRAFLPCLIEWLIFRDPASMNYANEIVCVDILQFATLTFLAFALFKWLRLGFVPMLAISAVCSIAGQLLQGVSTGSVVLDRIAGFFWNSNPTSFFPFLNWFIVPVIGYGLGKLWMRLKDKDAFFKLVTPISIVITAAYYFSMLLVGRWYYFSGEDYCGIGILDVVFMTVIFFVVVGGAYYLSKRQCIVTRYFDSIGQRLTSVYCIHWTIYCFLYLALLCVLRGRYMPLWSVPFVAAAVLVVSDLCSRFYKTVLLKRIRKHRTERG